MEIKSRRSYYYVTIIVFLLGGLLFFTTDFYQDKRAEKRRQEKLNYLNSIKRHYINEGVYVYKYELKDIKFKRDKFGNLIGERSVKGYINYEISFTSKKLIILNPQTKIKEEFIFKDKYKVVVSEGSSYYKFYIDSWRIRNQISDEQIMDILPTIEDDDSIRKPERLRITLNVEDGSTPYFFAYYGFRIPEYDGTGLISRDKSFLTIQLDELEYYYNNRMPDYVRLGKYNESVYNLANYRD